MTHFLFEWREAFEASAELSKSHKHLLWAMSRPMDRDGRCCYLGIAELARRTSMHPRTVERRRSELATKGWLDLVKPSKNNPRRGNEYDAWIPGLTDADRRRRRPDETPDDLPASDSQQREQLSSTPGQSPGLVPAHNAATPGAQWGQTRNELCNEYERERWRGEIDVVKPRDEDESVLSLVRSHFDGVNKTVPDAEITNLAASLEGLQLDAVRTLLQGCVWPSQVRVGDSFRAQATCRAFEGRANPSGVPSCIRCGGSGWLPSAFDDPTRTAQRCPDCNQGAVA